MPLALRVVALLACFVGVPSDGAGNDRPPTGGPAFFRSSTLPSTVSDDIIINKEVHIPVATAVEVEAGVTLTFTREGKIWVDGTLILHGSPKQSIAINGLDQAGGGLYFRPESLGLLQGVALQGAGRLVAEEGARLRLVNVTLVGVGLEARGAEVKVVAAKFVGAAAGAAPCVSASGQAGALVVERSVFEGCRGHAIDAAKFSGTLSIEGCLITDSRRYAIAVQAEGSSHIEGNHFRANSGVLVCTGRVALLDTAATDDKPARHVWSRNDVIGNSASLHGDPWSRGNVLYIHRCEVDVAENTVADTAPEPPETSAGASHSAPRPRSLANVFDARVTLVNNVLVNNSGFAYIINVGGSLSRVKLRHNLFSNANPKRKNVDVANEALEAVVDARLNWWGCATLSCVRQRVLDFTEGGERYGVVAFQPFLTSLDGTSEDSDAGDEEPLVQPPNRASDCLAQPNCTSRVVGQDETLSGHVVLRGNVWVSAGCTLTVAAGAVVELSPGTNLHVEGTLRLQGTAHDPVVFKPEVVPGTRSQPWGSISLFGATTVAFRHALFQGGGAPLPPVGREAGTDVPNPKATGMLLLKGRDFVFEDCVVQDSASGGIIVLEGNLTVRRCRFLNNAASALLHTAAGDVTVSASEFHRNGPFAVTILRAAYALVGNTWTGNKGVVCVRDQLREGRAAASLPGPEPEALFADNVVRDNALGPAAACWAEYGPDLLLMDFSTQAVVVRNNSIIGNRCDSAQIRSEVALFLLVANNVVDFVNNQVVKNYGTLTVQRRETKVESWEHEPQPFHFAANACLHNAFFGVFLRIPERPAEVTGNDLSHNEVTDASTVQQPLLEVVGGDFTLRPLRLAGNRLVGNEGLLLAVRLHSQAVATQNRFDNPYAKYELEFTGQDPADFTGTRNYWGDFSATDEEGVKARLRARDGRVPVRWYAHWVTRGGPAPPPPADAPATVAQRWKARVPLALAGGCLTTLGLVALIVWRGRRTQAHYFQAGAGDAGDGDDAELASGKPAED